MPTKPDLLKLVPEGLFVTRRSLLANGLSRHALDNLVKSEQLYSPARGVYTRPGTRLTWQGVVCSLQHDLQGVYVLGGLTALEMSGGAHYVPAGKHKTIHLYGDRPPARLSELVPNTEFVTHNISDLKATALVNHEYSTKEDQLYNRDPLAGFTQTMTWREDVWPLTVSSPERAYLEVLTDVPEKISFEHADQLLQGLTNLSPRRLQKLLEQCHSFKVRRLFFWLAERHQYAWLAKIDRRDIDIGTNKKMLVKGGKYVPKYLITVPKEMYGQN